MTDEKRPKEIYQEIIEDPILSAKLDKDYQDLVAEPTIGENELRAKNRQWDLIETDDAIETLPAKIENTPQSLNDDLAQAREKIYGALDVASKSIEELSQIAKQSQHPRAYEVVALLAKTITDSSKALMDVHKTDKEVKQKAMEIDEPKGDTNVTNNNVFIGTAAELDEFIAKMQGKKK